MNLKNIRDLYDLNTQVGYLSAIEQIVKDSEDRTVIESIALLKELEVVKESDYYETYFLKLYRFANDSMSNIIYK